MYAYILHLENIVRLEHFFKFDTLQKKNIYNNKADFYRFSKFVFDNGFQKTTLSSKTVLRLKEKSESRLNLSHLETRFSLD